MPEPGPDSGSGFSSFQVKGVQNLSSCSLLARQRIASISYVSTDLRDVLPDEGPPVGEDMHVQLRGNCPSLRNPMFIREFTCNPEKGLPQVQSTYLIQPAFGRQGYLGVGGLYLKFLWSLGLRGSEVEACIKRLPSLG